MTFALTARHVWASPSFLVASRVFWVSCFMLFFELLMIRWISSEIRIFAYFHNIVLLFAFFGIGLGAALARAKTVSLLATYVLMTVIVALVALDRYLGVSPLQDISQFLSQGTGFLIWWRFGSLPLRGQVIALLSGWVGLVVVMAMLTLFFLPFGQLLGRIFDQHERPLHAYALNLAGSLTGIWLFNAVSLLALPPTIWFALGGLGCLPLLRGRR